MHPITIIEWFIVIVLTVVLFAITLFIASTYYPERIKIALIVLLGIVILEILLFSIRPYWIDYQQDVKIEILNKYLEDKYPGDTWEVYSNDMKSHPRNIFSVRFENDPEWSSGYDLKDVDSIYQTNIGTPINSFQEDGKHYDADTFRHQ